MPYKSGYKRTQYFVAKKFQLKYVGLILILVFSTAIMCSYVIYYTMMLTMGDKLANIYPQGRLVAIVNTVNVRILFSMLLVTPIIVLIGIYASHRIAGPIGRIERFLDCMASGDLSFPLSIRSNDELVSLAGGINRVLDSMKVSVKKEREKLGNISASLENLKKVAGSKPVNHAALDQALDKLNKDVSVMKAEVGKYKI
jgi:methyl-accepting chemotaxis protein